MSISVLMSVYKSEKSSYLDRALKSVWDEQTLKPDEIILVEDGPLGEDLNEVIARWKERLSERLVLIYNETNLGLTKSLNNGLKRVRSEYIARMDSDDISDPLRLERQVNFMIAHPEIDILGGSLREFDESNKNLKVRHYPLTPDACRKYIVKASPLAHPTVMIRRLVFDSGIRYDERFRTSQDIALWFDLLVRGFKIANLPDVTINFRRSGDLFKRRSRNKAFNEFKIYLNGIYRLEGLFSWKYIYPLSRFVFRLMPPLVVKLIYSSRLRSVILK